MLIVKQCPSQCQQLHVQHHEHMRCPFLRAMMFCSKQNALAVPGWPGAASRCGRTPSRATRRDALLVPLVLIGAAQTCTAEARSSVPDAAASDARHLDPELAAAFMYAAYAAVQEQKLLPADQFQAEVFRLREREWPYFYAANKQRLPNAVNLDDGSGGLTNTTFYNFVSYVVWKVAVKHTSTPRQRSQLCASAAASLLAQIAPDALQQLQQAASASPSNKVPSTALVAAMSALLNRLQAGAYVQGWQLTWGELPGTWPADWVKSEPELAGEKAGNSPADGQAFQVRLSKPADIECCVALRAEEEAFWPHLVSSMLQSMLAAGGYADASVDEFFAQDYWSGPTDAKSRLLLALGDPLDMVEVPWSPTTLVQDWQLSEL